VRILDIDAYTQRQRTGLCGREEGVRGREEGVRGRERARVERFFDSDL
jgi:hypothetical protein